MGELAGERWRAFNGARPIATPGAPVTSTVINGITLEYEIQLFFRRAKQLQISWNDTSRCDDLIAEAILDGEAA